jgi:hypothetical protein
MTFEEALIKIKEEKRLTRRHWPKGKFVFLVKGSSFKVNRPPLLGIFKEGTEVDYHPHIDIRYEDKTVGVWHPQTYDLLADDWAIVNDNPVIPGL